ncbi:uncharacterized protein MYCFIDRAFT_38166 [Pseudocercospora fijiensis CIRAD86]|uniref:Major facilitator superfamily (MFS) profile domain-containing protein n=1 Tax=Pseudocercospora fijiensis (strain CIRAD86) TaxID=383855 RepID=M3AVD4_PSEFD|nr:uncharacterized protein MYCFIDRAFT_38166 [Pseudocercospora fijiensis CIRAD86]EME81447.1 hypothetical protein MYCFIDRAFT_38166 [Pseudocercospora fijiensis CIRAD86]
MEEDALLGAAETTLEDIKQFAEQYGLDNRLELLQDAAALLRDGETAATSDGNRRSKWSQPLQLYLCILATAFGALGQGWAQTGINGANLYFPQVFGIGPLIVGFINAGIYFSTGILGSWLVAPMNKHLGRRATVFAGALISLLFNLGGSAAGSWQSLLVCRFALGIGLGLTNCTLNIFAAESAPAAIRGGLGVAWQMYTAFGVFVGFLTNMLVDSNPEAYGPLRWRVMLMAPALPTVPLMFLIFVCPESPAWLIKQTGDYGRAFQSLARLRNTELEAAQEIVNIHAQRKRVAKIVEPRSFGKTVVELFTIPRVRRATLAAYSAQISQQLCGINIVAFYSSTIFVQAHFTTYAAEMASTIFGLVNFLGAFPAIWTMDSLGRRSLLLLTLPPMAVSMAIAGFSFSISDDSATLRFGLTTSMIYLFCLLYSPGMGPVPATYSAEVFPLSHREVGTSSAIAVTSLFATILSLSFPWLLSVLGTQGSFLLYAVLNVVAWVLVFLFVPETKRRTLEELDETFSLATGDFVRYQVQEVAPWWIKTHLLRRKDVKLAAHPSEGYGHEYTPVERDSD